MKNLNDELSLEYIRASGPGGQNVNKVATAVQLRFNASASPSLSAETKARLYKIAGRRMTGDGVLVIEAHRFRTQEKNREDATERFYELIKRAGERPKLRHKTKPTRASKEKRLTSKKIRGNIKRTRGNKKGLMND